MESTLILPFVVSLVLVPLSLYLLSFILKMGFTDNKKLHLPPGSKGWPLMLGENIEFARSGTEKFVYTRMEKYSADVFQSSLFGQNIAIFCGPQGNKFLFMNENKLVTPWLPQSFKKAFGFPEFLERSAKELVGPAHRFRHDMFKLEALKDYIPVMDALARQHLDNYWSTPPSKVVKVYPMMKKFTFEVACRLFMNLVDPELITKLINPFNQIFEGLFSFPIDFPGTAYNRAIKASKNVREQIMRIIKERRKELLISTQQNKDVEMINCTDVLSKMLLEGTQDFSDAEICYNIMGLLMASYETTSATLSAVMCYLAQLPHIYEKVFKEQIEIAKSDELLTWKDIEKMKYSWNVARETLRLTPTGPGGLGETTTEFTYAGFTIPKGWKTLWTFCSSHMNPEYFPEPKKFDPSRFEGNGPPPYTFVPFGGGPRMCPGKEYARLIILVTMHNVVIRFKLEQLIPNDNFVIHTSATSATGLPIHLHPHDK